MFKKKGKVAYEGIDINGLPTTGTTEISDRLKLFFSKVLSFKTCTQCCEAFFFVTVSDIFL